MPTAAKFEVLEGTQLDITSTSSRKVTRGVVTGLPTTSDPDPETIWAIIGAIASYDATYQLGLPLTNHTNLILQRILARGFRNDGCVVDLYHETALFGGPPSALIVRNRTYLAQRSSHLIFTPGGAIKCNVLAYEDAVTGQEIKADLANISRFAPMREYSVEALVYGTAPPDDEGDIVGSVNSAPWRGKSAGYWLISEYETDVARYSGYYQKRVGAITKLNEDWSEWAVLFNKRTGNYVGGEAGGTLDDNIAQLRALNYLAGIQARPGVSRFGPYPAIPFFPIFGT